MFYHLAHYFQSTMSFLNIVHYVSFRVIASLLTALFISLLFGSTFINYSQHLFRSHVREYTPESHQSKNLTPTMGGLFILFVTFLSTLLWSNLSHAEVWIFLACLLGFGGIGFWDDWSKIRHRKGIKEKHKFLAQIIMGIFIINLWIYFVKPPTVMCVPFFKGFTPDLGLFIIPWGVFVLVAMSNGVNLTDGLDGLAIGSLIPNFATFSAICYLAGNYLFAHYLHIPFTPTAEIAVIGAVLVGASLGFLWYNAYPAQIFMGDVGSLSLGAGLGLMGLMARQELLLIVSGALFVIETLSVLAQVLSVKIRGKRIFKMAPIHHHFELIGWQEAKITVRFAILSLIACLLALITLKIR